DHSLAVGRALRMRDRRDARSKPFDLLQLHSIPRGITDHGIEPASWGSALPLGPDAWKRGFPMKKTVFRREGTGIRDKRSSGGLDFGRGQAPATPTQCSR